VEASNVSTSLRQTNTASFLTQEMRKPARSYLSASWAKLRRDWISLAALAVLIVIAVLSFASPWINANILHQDPNAIDLDNIFAPPSREHWVGTDELGRDVLARVLVAGSVSLSIGLAVSVVSMTLGVLVGLFSGFFGGIFDDASNAVIQTLLNIPLIFLLLIMSLVFRPSPFVLALIIGITGWMGTARLVRGEVFSLRERDYVEAARMVGATSWRIMTRHVLPNIGSLIIVVAAFAVAGAILAESGLSFLGVGVQPPTATWGNMLINSREYVNNGWWLLAAPGTMIFLTNLGIFLFANGLRDALDPWVSR
jgi:peptide/nickel transport system permease protein